MNLMVRLGSLRGAQNIKKGMRKISMVMVKIRIPHTAQIFAKIFFINFNNY